ncbi:hypothetical protein CONLIGDRAFT_6193 [Coniochaeta ligniaria NRRL 30616]|uniref:Uncharacterized protein n=1 Tax=Coniochaeta ligniaria NRRL 30616 TaxID=1408157 RepID=A0A1J7K2T5_9PEZI|nr:hypothetical protein CONLIGDRAFT_6193 [Coniochaeta ligniaria NRRL 30616]
MHHRQPNLMEATCPFLLMETLGTSQPTCSQTSLNPKSAVLPSRQISPRPLTVKYNLLPSGQSKLSSHITLYWYTSSPSLAMEEPTSPPTGEEVMPLTAREVLLAILTSVKYMAPAGGPDNSVAGRVHMALFRRGHQFQSRVLRIPDRYGLFWAAPFNPEAERGQGQLFAVEILMSVSFLVTFMPLLLLLEFFDPGEWMFLMKLFGAAVFLPFVTVWLLSVWVRWLHSLGIRPSAADLEARK